MTANFVESSFCQQDIPFEVPLRPQGLDEFCGQDSIKDRLSILIQAAKQRGEALGHCLFSGPPGLGKTTLANILAKAMGSQIVITSGPVLEKAGDLAGLLTNLKAGDILFIDELHRLNRTLEEYLYSAMEDFVLDIVIDSGPSARSVRLPLPPFTLVGATTRSGLISAPMRSRFSMSSRLDYYSNETLSLILQRTSRILNLHIDEEGLTEVAKRSRGTPRIANNLLRWVRDYAQIYHGGKIEVSAVKQALEMLAVDECGLDEMDKKILEVIIDHHQGGPVGLNAIAAAIGEEKSTVEEVYEPYLVLKGFIKRTPRGREATELAYRHLNKINGA